MVGVIVDEVPGQLVEFADADVAAVDFEPALEQLAGAGADHVARLVQGHRRQALAVEHEIERRDQVGRGVDEGAVEIEDEGAGKGHRNSLFGDAFRCKRGMVGFPASWRCSRGQNDAREASPAGAPKPVFSRGTVFTWIWTL